MLGYRVGYAQCLRYLDRCEFDLYTDHKVLTWIFNATRRTSNAKLIRWAMELSQLRFKVFHKYGTSMGLVDGLYRLYTQTVSAISMSKLLNDADESTHSTVEVGEAAPPASAQLSSGCSLANPGDSNSVVSPEEEETSDQLLVSSVDVFGLQQTRFVEEQKRIP